MNHMGFVVKPILRRRHSDDEKGGTKHSRCLGITHSISQYSSHTDMLGKEIAAEETSRRLRKSEKTREGASRAQMANQITWL